MPKLIAWFVDNPVAANLLMFILIASGLLALNDVRKEEFPNIEAPVSWSPSRIWVLPQLR